MPLRQACDIQNFSNAEKIEMNLISFFDDEFIEIGSYFNVNIADSGDYVNDISALTKVTDVRGAVKWAGRQNWIYESGLDSDGVIFPPTIYVNGSGYELGTISYTEGCVYDIPASATSVQAGYSYKWINFLSARKTGLSKLISHDQTDLSLLAEKRIPLPAVMIEVPPKFKSTKYGLVSIGPDISTYKINMRVIGGNDNDVLRIAEVLSDQENLTIKCFNPDLIRDSGDYPLNSDGTLNSGKTHQQLSDEYEWQYINLSNITAKNGEPINNSIFHATITMDAKILTCGCS